MRILVCLDDIDGMSFCGRRQSKDRELRRRILELTAGEPIWMSSYSARQFEEPETKIQIAENFLEQAGKQDWCFVENQDLRPWCDQIHQVVIFRWNRRYPGDNFFPRAQFSEKWHLLETREFPGSSHDIITEEVYRL